MSLYRACSLFSLYLNIVVDQNNLVTFFKIVVCYNWYYWLIVHFIKVKRYVKYVECLHWGIFQSFMNVTWPVCVCLDGKHECEKAFPVLTGLDPDHSRSERNTSTRSALTLLMLIIICIFYMFNLSIFYR